MLDPKEPNVPNRNARLKLNWLTILYALSAIAAFAQAPMPQQQGMRAQQLPLSTQEQGNISAQQNAGPGAGASVNTVQSTVNVSGRYQGSILDLSANPTEVVLSFNDSIQRGLHFNLGGQTAGNMQTEVRAQWLAALSQLLPNITGVLSQSVAQVYLPAEGLSSSTFGGGGLKIPATTGQFHYYTLQGTFSEDAFNLTAIHNLQGAEAASAAAKLSARDARELIVLGVGGTYQGLPGGL